MAVKIRLQRHGKKGKPFFHIVAADSRSPRDGKFIERLGSYNPNTNPATIVLDNDKTMDWLNKGAQPTDTARAILSYRGIMYRQHLAKGVAKGVLTQEDADNKFDAWMTDKENKINAKREGLLSSRQSEEQKKLKHESEINEARKRELAAALAPVNVTVEKPEAEAAEVAAPVESPATAETTTDAPSEPETPAAE